MPINLRHDAKGGDGMDLLTIQEAADYLTMHRATFYRKVMADPSVPRLRHGGMVRFRKSDLDAWVERNTEGEARG